MPKTELKIRVFGDTVLRKKAKAVRKITGYHRDMLSQMARLMYDSKGIGLAAPQVGIGEMMIVVDIGDGLYKLVNPKIVKKEGFQVIQEGCLSVPGISLKVRRAKKVSVEAIDENGDHIFIEAKDLLACVLQHEIDHLYGRLIIDYSSLLDRIKIKKRLEKLKKESSHEELPEPETKSYKLQL